MPALADVLRAHAEADARAGLVAGGGGGEEFLAAEFLSGLGNGDERGQHHGADVQYARAVHVVELEALHLGAVGERGVRGGEALASAPDAAAFVFINTL